jgi:hypothetical protein
MMTGSGMATAGRRGTSRGGEQAMTDDKTWKLFAVIDQSTEESHYAPPRRVGRQRTVPAPITMITISMTSTAATRNVVTKTEE